MSFDTDSSITTKAGWENISPLWLSVKVGTNRQKVGA